MEKTVEELEVEANQHSAGQWGLAGWAAARALEKWKQSVVDKLIVSHCYKAEHETNPELAINDLISWEVNVALDPAVSEQAQALVDRGATDLEAYRIGVKHLHEELDTLTRERDEAIEQSLEAMKASVAALKNGDALRAELEALQPGIDHLRETCDFLERERGALAEKLKYAERKSARRFKLALTLVEQRDALRAEVERLQKAETDFHMAYRLKCDEETKALYVDIESAKPAMREYAAKNPRHLTAYGMQDPGGAHAWLERNDKQEPTP